MLQLSLDFNTATCYTDRMIVYIHGFGSVGASSKTNLMKRDFGAENVFAPNFPFNPVEVSAMVAEIVKNFVNNRPESSTEKLIFVGTSLGGFYANYFGHIYDCPIVMINPAINPGESLRNRLGTNKNFATNELFEVTVEHLEQFDKMREYLKKNYDGSLVNLFLAKDDTIIPYEPALTEFRFTKFTCVSDNGGHRYTENWDHVSRHVKRLLND